MTQSPRYSDGDPCWIDLCTHDLAGAQHFYGGLFGWTFDPPEAAQGGYVNARLGGLRVAGMMQSTPEMPMPTTWSVHLLAEDMDATERRVVEAGGKAIYRHELPNDLGTTLLASDITGAMFEAVQLKAHRGSERFDEPGALAWAEVYTREAAATDRFYRDVFNYESAPLANTRNVDYAVYSREGRDVCGRLHMTAAWGDMPPHWLGYFRVAGLDAALTKLRQLDGRVVVAPFDSPKGRIAIVGDPQGAMFALIERPADA